MTLEQRILAEFPEFEIEDRREQEIFYCEKNENNWRINKDWARNKEYVSLFREAIREYKIASNDYNFIKFIFPDFWKKIFILPKNGAYALTNLEEEHYAFWKQYWISDIILQWNVIDFSRAIFKWDVNFSWCKFLWQVLFCNTKFENYANFGNSIFEDFTSFNDAHFYKWARFWKTNFWKKDDNSTNFWNTNFEWNVDFIGTNFNKSYFSFWKVNWNLKFRESIFWWKAEFDEIKLWKDANILFEECVKIKKDEKSHIKEDEKVEISFEKTEINDQFTFRDMYLGRTSFLHSHISCTNFFNCSWYNYNKEEKEKRLNKSSLSFFFTCGSIFTPLFLYLSILSWMEQKYWITIEIIVLLLFLWIIFLVSKILYHIDIANTNFQWFDENFILNDMSNPDKKNIKEVSKNRDYKAMQRVYCQFKKKFEDMKDWQLAWDFFIGEMEMRREYLKKNKYSFFNFELWFLSLYRSISFYWERFKDVIDLYFYMILSASWVVLLFSQNRPFYKIELNRNIIKDPSNYREALSLTFRSMTFQKDSWFEAYSFAVKNIITIEFVIGAILLWILLLAIRRKFRR